MEPGTVLLIGRRAAVLGALFLSACAMLPNTAGPEIEHMSHVTQHAPFTSKPTNYGSNMANLVLRWNVASHLKLELAEGIDLDRHYPGAWGEIEGPREEFSMRIGYDIAVREP